MPTQHPKSIYVHDKDQIGVTSTDLGAGKRGLDVTATVSGTPTVDTELPAAVTLADDTATPTVPGVGAFLMGYQQSANDWDRLRSGSINTDGITAYAEGVLSARAHISAFNGTTWDRVRGDVSNGLDVDVTRVSGTVTVDSELAAAATLSDAFANPTTAPTGSFGMGYNGSTWDRLRSDTTNGLDVDVTRVIPGTTSTALGKAEDSPHTTGDTGVMALGVVKGSNGPIVGADGDYQPFLMDINGSVKQTGFGSAGLPQHYNNVLGLVEVPSMVIVDSASLAIATVTDSALQITGNVAHDSADAGKPNKIGGKAASYEPSTSDQPSANKTAVAAADRTDAAFNLFGESIEGVNGYFFTLNNVSTTYNNTTTTATSTAKECWNYRQATFSYEATRANSPTDILFEIEVSLNNGSTFTVAQNDFLGDLRESAASITASGIKKSVTFPIACHSLRVKATATGTTATNTITIANACIYFRN